MAELCIDLHQLLNDKKPEDCNEFRCTYHVEAVENTLKLSPHIGQANSFEISALKDLRSALPRQ